MNTTLKKKLDKLHSEWIRRRAANRQGYVQCVTCGKMDHWKNMDCGHYISRRHLSTRYDERNAAPQCRYCNRFNEGDKPRFVVYLIQKYGNDLLFELDLRRKQITQISDADAELMAMDYKQKLKELDGNI